MMLCIPDNLQHEFWSQPIRAEVRRDQCSERFRFIKANPPSELAADLVSLLVPIDNLRESEKEVCESALAHA